MNVIPLKPNQGEEQKPDAKDAEIVEDAPKQQRRFWQRTKKTPEEVLEARLEHLEREQEQTVKWDHRTGNMLVFAIAMAAMLGMSPDAVIALASGHYDAKALLPVIVAFVVVVGANRALISAASDVRYHRSRKEAVPHEARLVMYTVMAIEAISFHYMISVLTASHDTTIQALDWGRSVLLPYLTVYLEQKIVKPIDPKTIATQAEIGSGIGVMYEVVRLAYNRAIPLALKLQNYRAVAELDRPMDEKLRKMTHAAMAIQKYLDTGEILLIEEPQAVLLGPNGKPISSSIADNTEDSDTENEADTESEEKSEETNPVKRFLNRAKGNGTRRKSNTKTRSDRETEKVVEQARLSAIRALLSVTPDMSNYALAQELKLDETQVARLRKKHNI